MINGLQTEIAINDFIETLNKIAEHYNQENSDNALDTEAFNVLLQMAKVVHMAKVHLLEMFQEMGVDIDALQAEIEKQEDEGNGDNHPLGGGLDGI